MKFKLRTRIGKSAAVLLFAFFSVTACAGTLVALWGPLADPVDDVYLSSPVTMAVDAKGDLYVADMGNSRLVKFEIEEEAEEGSYQLKIRVDDVFGQLGSGAGEFNLPFGVTMDRQGNILVSDTANKRVQKFDPLMRFVRAWGQDGSGPGEFGMPREIAVDAQNRYYVTDEFNNRIQVFDQDGNYLYEFGSFGSAPGQFRLPQGVAVDPSGRVLVADTFNHRIQVLSATGEYLTQIGTTGVTGDSGSLFFYPRGVSVDDAGNVFVADTFNNKVKKYDAALSYQYSVGGYPLPLYPNSVRPDNRGAFYVTDTGNSQVVRYRDLGTSATLSAVLGAPRSADGQFSEPNGIDVGPDGRVYVADRFNHRIQVFDGQGNFLGKWGKNGGAGTYLSIGTGPGEFHMPGQISITAAGQVYVADTLNSRVQILDADGNHQSTLGGFGFTPGSFVMPTGVAVDGDGEVFVVDWATAYIQKFDANHQFAGIWGGFGLGDGQFRRPTEVSVDAAGNVYIVDSLNSRIQKFDNNGNFLGKWGTHGGNPEADQLLNWGTADGELFLPQGIRVAGDTVYVSDTSNNRLQRFDLEGNFLGKWGSWGGRPQQFFSPTSIAVDPAGYIYTVDLLLHRVQKFAP